MYRAWRPPVDGRRASRTFEGPDAEARASAWAAGDVPADVLTVGAYMRRWFKARSATLRPNTRSGYLDALEHLGADLVALPLAATTATDWQARLGYLLERGTAVWRMEHGRRVPTGETRPLAVGTVKLIRRVWWTALDDAVPDLLPANPLRRTRLPKAPPAPPKAWTVAEVGRLLAAAEGWTHEALLHVGLAVGARLGELRELRWSDLDEVAATLTIARSVSSNGRIVGPTKTSLARTVEVPPETLALLLDHRRRRPVERALMFGRTDNDRPYSAVGIRTALRNLCVRAGVTPLTPHALRHTAASLMLHDGVSLPEVARVLGHSSAATTSRIYSHWIGDSHTRAVSVMRRALYERGEPPTALRGAGG